MKFWIAVMFSYLAMFNHGVTKSFTPKGWTEYLSEEGRMRISFPAKYKVTRDSLSTLTKVEIRAEYKDEAYIASYSLYRVPLDKPEELTEVTLNRFVQSTGGELLKTTEFTIGTYLGKQAVIQLNKGYIHYRTIIVDQIQYQLIYISRDEKLSDNGSRFFDSFEILNP